MVIEAYGGPLVAMEGPEGPRGVSPEGFPAFLGAQLITAAVPCWTVTGIFNGSYWLWSADSLASGRVRFIFALLPSRR